MYKQIAHLVIGYAVVKASLRLQNIFVYFALNYLSGKFFYILPFKGFGLHWKLNHYPLESLSYVQNSLI